MEKLIEVFVRSLSTRTAKLLLVLIITGIVSVALLTLPSAFSAEKAWRTERVEVEQLLEKRLDAKDVSDAELREAVKQIQGWTKETRDDVREMRRDRRRGGGE